MGDYYSHDHSNKNLKVAFFLNLAFTILEFIGGTYVNSVAILADAVHDLGDSLSLGTAWYLQVKSKKTRNKKYTFGYRRFSLFGALINSIVLIAGAIYAIYEAIDRFMEPSDPNAQGMMWFAFLGIAVNGYAAWKLSKGKTMNEKVVSWHLIEDVLGWVAILVVAVVLQFKHIPYLDPALSLAITLYILWNVVKRLKETLFIFLQGLPKDVNRDLIERELLQVNNVQSLHDTHIWSLDGEHHVFSTHVKLKAISNFQDYLTVKKELNEVIAKYSFEHYTIATELDEESCDFEAISDPISN